MLSCLVALQVLVFVVFCATDSKRSAVGPHLPVSAKQVAASTCFAPQLS
jgi:hypothetical protein